jgi:hypothetical protein
MHVKIKLDKQNRILKLCIACCDWQPAFTSHFALVGDNLDRVCSKCRAMGIRAPRRSKIRASV